MAMRRSRSEAETVSVFRFGYGFHGDAPVPASPEALVAALADRGAPALETPLERWGDRWDLVIRFRKGRRDQTADYERAREAMRARLVPDRYALLEQRAWGRAPVFERFAAFWADHFAVKPRNLPMRLLAPYFEAEAIRPRLGGRFADLMAAAVLHPLMLVSLDQQSSVGPGSTFGQKRGRGLNENLARELLELHTLGVGGAYDQRDVRALAFLLTGLRVDPKDGGRRFRRGAAEPGRHVVLGRGYGGRVPAMADIDAVLRDIAAHPDVARHLAEKLVRHFVADTPPPALVAHVEAAWRRTDGHLPSVHAALIEHPEAWRAPGAKVRRPVEFVAALMRAAGRPGARRPDKTQQREIVVALTGMGQEIYAPDGPDGWPETGEDWITPAALAIRLQLASRAGEILARDTRQHPAEFAERVLGAALSEDTAWTVRVAAERWEGFALALASPEFNRR